MNKKRIEFSNGIGIFLDGLSRQLSNFVQSCYFKLNFKNILKKLDTQCILFLFLFKRVVLSIKRESFTSRISKIANHACRTHVLDKNECQCCK